MKENEKKAFDFAAETTKQLITLSTAIIALTITFSKDINSGLDADTKIYIFWAWGLYIASVLFGIWTLMALTGSLQPMKKLKNQEKNKPEQNSQESQQESDQECYKISINGYNVRLPSIIQISFFVAALILTGIFGYKSINAANNSNADIEDCIKIIKKSKFWIENQNRTKTIDLKELNKAAHNIKYK